MNVFTYGSLMFPEVWRRAAGEAGAGEPASLKGHEVRALRGHSYPIMIPVSAASSAARGILYREVSEAALARLDVFEGGFYTRALVTVKPDGPEETRVSAWTYLPTDPAHPSILPDLWDAAAFRERHLAAFLSDDPGFRGGGGERP